MTRKEADFIAILKYKTFAESGRKTPASSGYRPQVKFEFTEMQTSGQQTFIDKEIVLPGETVEAEIKLLSPRFFINSLTVGMEFEFREGARVMGTGKIQRILNEELRKIS